MAGKTTIPFGDKRAIRRWSGRLFVDAVKKSYFEQRFVGTDENAVIQRLTDLESGAGDTIQYDISLQLRNKPVKGDNRLDGREENLKFASDEVTIDQLRHAVTTGGRMTRKRTSHDLRSVGKNRLSEYWAAYNDQLIFMYLSGARGVGKEFIEDEHFVGTAKNAFQAPDNEHLIFAGEAASKATLKETDIMSRAVIERATVKATTMRSKGKDLSDMVPVMIEGGAHFICVMSKFQEHDMRTKDQAGWMDIQKAAMTAEGRKNRIFTGGLGMINNCVLHSHERVITFNDYGSGKNVEAARALLLGAQAAVIAYGSTKGMRYSWHEEKKDHDNEHVISSGVILGAKKTRFNDSDFGVLSIDTAAKDPNPIVA